MELWQEFELLCKGIIHIETVCKEWKVLNYLAMHTVFFVICLLKAKIK